MFATSFDCCFQSVIEGCAEPRVLQGGKSIEKTWITENMMRAYVELHNQGYAHSVETWFDGRLVGGLYGVSVGRMFCGESMFSLVPDASKVALHRLISRMRDWEFLLLDCQDLNPHTRSLGAFNVPRAVFLNIVEHNNRFESRTGKWTDTELDTAPEGAT